MRLPPNLSRWFSNCTCSYVPAIYNYFRAITTGGFLANCRKQRMARLLIMSMSSKWQLCVCLYLMLKKDYPEEYVTGFIPESLSFSLSSSSLCSCARVENPDCLSHSFRIHRSAKHLVYLSCVVSNIHHSGQSLSTADIRLQPVLVRKEVLELIQEVPDQSPENRRGWAGIIIYYRICLGAGVYK